MGVTVGGVAGGLTLSDDGKQVKAASGGVAGYSGGVTFDDDGGVKSVAGGGAGLAGGVTFADKGGLERANGSASVNGATAGLAFSPTTFEANASFPLWVSPPYEVPIPVVPGLFAFITPSVTISGGTIDDREKATRAIPTAVTGTVSIGFSYGSQHVAALTGALNANATGAFEYKRGPESARKLSGTLSLSSAFAIGARVAGGMLSYNYEFGQVAPIVTLKDIVWENGTFKNGTFEWGPRLDEFFEILKKTVAQGQRLVDAGTNVANAGKRVAERTIRGAADLAGNAWDKITSW